MVISTEMEDILKQPPFCLEMEMMSGERTVLNDGRIEYHIEINDPDKDEVIKEFMLKTISKSQNACKN